MVFSEDKSTKIFGSKTSKNIKTSKNAKKNNTEMSTNLGIKSNNYEKHCDSLESQKPEMQNFQNQKTSKKKRLGKKPLNQRMAQFSHTAAMSQKRGRD